jgi:hypothetical protein
MALDSLQLKAQQIIDTSSGTAYFVLVKLREDPNDLEASSIDVRVTDGKRCWSKEGMPCFPLSNHLLVQEVLFQSTIRDLLLSYGKFNLFLVKISS